MSNSTYTRVKSNYDVLGILFSVACLLHCLALPLLSFIAPTLTVFLKQEWIHLLLLALLIPIALFSFINGKKRHMHNTPLVLGVTGVSFLLLAIALEGFSDINFEAIFTVCGSLMLTVAHVFNIKYKI